MSAISVNEISDWDLCHHCGGSLDGESVTILGRYAYQDVGCLECDATWTEEYEAKRRLEEDT